MIYRYPCANNHSTFSWYNAKFNCCTWHHTCYLKGFVIKWGCDAKINSCRLAQLPVRDEDIGRTCLPCLMTQAAAGFELCTQACTLAELKKGVSDSVVARNHVRPIFT